MKINSYLLVVCWSFFCLGCSSRMTAYQVDEHGALHINEYKIIEKDIPSFDFVHHKGLIPQRELALQSKPIAKRVFIAANVQGMELVGPLTMIFNDLRYLAGGPLTVAMGFPATGDFSARNGITLMDVDSFTCLTVSVPVDVLDIETYWAALIRATYRFGYQPSGEFRSVLKFNDTNTGYLMELQVGV